MFETFQTLINAGGYDLADLTERIKTMYVSNGKHYTCVMDGCV